MRYARRRKTGRGVNAAAWFYSQPGFHSPPPECTSCGERHEVADGYECGAECPLCGFELWTMKPGDIHRHEVD